MLRVFELCENFGEVALAATTILLIYMYYVAAITIQLMYMYYVNVKSVPGGGALLLQDNLISTRQMRKIFTTLCVTRCLLFLLVMLIMVKYSQHWTNQSSFSSALIVESSIAILRAVHTVWWKFKRSCTACISIVLTLAMSDWSCSTLRFMSNDGGSLSSSSLSSLPASSFTPFIFEANGVSASVLLSCFLGLVYLSMSPRVYLQQSEFKRLSASVLSCLQYFAIF